MFRPKLKSRGPRPAADTILPFGDEPMEDARGRDIWARRSLFGSDGVRIWLLVLTFLVFVMVIVGGMTRLTDSGLSITEWKPVVGAVPPLSQSAWQDEFERYRATPQYGELNRGMSLGEFKRIYWWEWGHRQLGRFIGLVYIVGLVWAGVTRRVSAGQWLWLLAGGLLLGLQGLVGWIMVASGLRPGMIAVAPVKLALHLSLASIFFAFLIGTHAGWGGAEPEKRGRAGRTFAICLALLALFQIALGGLVAGHDAGMTYNTWPLMDGRFVPAGLMTMQPAWHNFTDNITTVQFDHRIGGYVLAVLVLLYALWASAGGRLTREIGALLFLVLLQVGLGITAILLVVPLHVAITHQAVALLLFGLMVRHAARPSIS